MTRRKPSKPTKSTIPLKTYTFTARVELQGRFEVEAEDSEQGRKQAEIDALDECCEHGELVDWEVEEYIKK